MQACRFALFLFLSIASMAKHPMAWAVAHTFDEMSLKNYYELLGVDQNAETSAIRRAWKEFALLNHPDRFSEGDPLAYDEKTNIFALHSHAFDTLSDPASRRKYDQTLIHGKAQPNEKTAAIYDTFTYGHGAHPQTYEQYAGKAEGTPKEERLTDIEAQSIAENGLKPKFWKTVEDFFDRHVNLKIDRITLTSSDYLRLSRALHHVMASGKRGSLAVIGMTDSYLDELEYYVLKKRLMPSLGSVASPCSGKLTSTEVSLKKPL